MFHTWKSVALVWEIVPLVTVTGPVVVPAGTITSYVFARPVTLVAVVEFDPVNFTFTVPVAPASVKRILSPITPALASVRVFGFTIGIVFVKVTAAFAGAAITFTGITIAAVSTIDTILKRFNSFTPEIFAARLNFDVAKANFSR